MLTYRRIAGAAVAALASATLLLPAPSTAATSQCTARGVMPHRVALHKNRTVVQIYLRGSAACHDQRTDNGATATLVRPSGAGDAMRWRHFGSAQGVTMYVNIVRSGTFRLEHGNVQVYNQSYRRVPWSWVRTSMIVKRAAHISPPSATGGVVSARAQRFTMYGWQSYSHKRLFVQRRAVGSAVWHTLGSRYADKQGRVHYPTSTSPRFEFRVTLRASGTVWNARSRVVRG